GQLAVALGRQVDDDEDRQRIVGREGRQQCREGLDGPGGAADQHDLGSEGGHTVPFFWYSRSWRSNSVKAAACAEKRRFSFEPNPRIPPRERESLNRPMARSCSSLLK